MTLSRHRFTASIPGGPRCVHCGASELHDIHDVGLWKSYVLTFAAGVATGALAMGALT